MGIACPVTGFLFPSPPPPPPLHALYTRAPRLGPLFSTRSPRARVYTLDDGGREKAAARERRLYTNLRDDFLRGNPGNRRASTDEPREAREREENGKGGLYTYTRAVGEVR